MMPELSFNIDHGYLEGLLRGFKGGILKQTDYLNLVQCETLDGESIFFQNKHSIQFTSIHSCLSSSKSSILAQYVKLPNIYVKLPNISIKILLLIVEIKQKEKK